MTTMPAAYGRTYMQQRRATWREAARCSMCGHPPTPPKAPAISSVIAFPFGVAAIALG